MQFPLPIRSITLDLDGTLLDTAPDLTRAVNAMQDELGLPRRSAAQVRDFIGKGVPNLVKRSITFDKEPDAALLTAANATFRRHYAECNGQFSQPYPGVFEGLKSFRALGLKLVIVTNKADAFTLPLVDRSGLAPYVEFTIAGDTLPRKKPDPLPLQHACQRMGVPAQFNLHIGDSQNDFHSARAAGCPVFLVPYGYNEGKDVRLLECDAIVASLVHAVDLITAI